MINRFDIPDSRVPIPAVLWGEPSTSCLIAVHGNLSHKEDTVIEIAAREAVRKGYQVLSFDLPKHGERSDQEYALLPENSVRDLSAVYQFAQSISTRISLFACSIGAYFSLLALRSVPLRQSLFLSPVVNMERLIQNMMQSVQVSEESLRDQGQIALPIGEVLDWDYYRYVKNHPVTFGWPCPTDILYGEKDDLCEWETMSAFAQRYGASVQVLEGGEHFFHTPPQLEALARWVAQTIEPEMR